MPGQQVVGTDVRVNRGLGFAVEREILNELLAQGSRIGYMLCLIPPSSENS
jgi:hypothetical protein